MQWDSGVSRVDSKNRHGQLDKCLGSVCLTKWQQLAGLATVNSPASSFGFLFGVGTVWPIRRFDKDAHRRDSNGSNLGQWHTLADWCTMSLTGAHLSPSTSTTSSCWPTNHQPTNQRPVPAVSAIHPVHLRFRGFANSMLATTIALATTSTNWRGPLNEAPSFSQHSPPW